MEMTEDIRLFPAKWKEEGDKTLKPSAKMMGKVYEAYEDK